VNRVACFIEVTGFCLSRRVDDEVLRRASSLWADPPDILRKVRGLGYWTLIL
jgi:hypothetical protein